MKQYIGCDAHARYSVFVSVDETGRIGPAVRVEHGGRDLRDYLKGLEKETPVAVEASGGWYWFMDELEAAGLDARLVNPLEAKRRIRGPKKTDKAGCARAGNPIAQWNTSRGLGTAGGTAGLTGADAWPAGDAFAYDCVEESDSCGTETVWHVGRGSGAGSVH